MNKKSDKSHGDWDHRIEEGWLDLYLAGQLDDDATTELEEHLTGCAECRGQLEQIKSLDEAIAGSLGYHASTSDMADRVIYNVFKSKSGWSGGAPEQFGLLLRAAAVLFSLMACGFFLEASGNTAFRYDTGVYHGYAAPEALSVGMLADGENMEWSGNESEVQMEPADRTIDKDGDAYFGYLGGERAQKPGNSGAGEWIERPRTDASSPAKQTAATYAESLKRMDSSDLKTKLSRQHELQDAHAGGGVPLPDINDIEYKQNAGLIHNERIADENSPRPKTGKVQTGGTSLDISGEVEVDSVYREEQFPGVLSADPKEPQQDQGSNNPPPAREKIATNMKLIYNGFLSFEIAAYQSALDTIYKICNEQGGFVSSENSSRGANGKIRGQVILRVPPENFDRTITSLRGLGDLKNQSVSTRDVTEEYFDIASRIRNKQTLEKRLLEIIEKREGKMEEILKVEQELAKVREEIEVMQGKIKMFDNLVGLSTITLDLMETGINDSSVFVRTETGTLHVAAKDVADAYAKAKEAAEKHKARVTSAVFNESADNRQHSATMQFDMALEAFHPMMTDLKALGLVRAVDVQVSNQPKNGRGGAELDATRNESGKGTIYLTFTTLQQVTKESASVQLNAPDVNEAFGKAKQLAADAKAEIKFATISENSGNKQLQANMQFEVASEQFQGFLTHLQSLGNVFQQQVQSLDTTRREKPFGDVPGNTVAVISLVIYELKTVYTQAGSMAMDVDKVEEAYTGIQAKLKDTKAKVISAALDRKGTKVTGASIELEIDENEYSAFLAYVKGLGFVTKMSTATDDKSIAEDMKVVFEPRKLARLSLALRPTEPILTKETTVKIRVDKVKDRQRQARDLAMQNGCEIIDDHSSDEAGSTGNASLVVKVPATGYESLMTEFGKLGKQIGYSSETPQVSEQSEIQHRPKMALVTLNLTDFEPTLPGSTGVFGYVFDSFKAAFGYLMGSIRLIMVGLSFVLPFLLLALVVWKVTNRSKPEAA